MRGEAHQQTPPDETSRGVPDGSQRLVWPDHDELPPGGTGAWLYVADARTLEHGPIRGAWIPAHLDDHEAAMAVGSVTGESLARWHLVVIDQVGRGEEMVDEDRFTPGSHR